MRGFTPLSAVLLSLNSLDEYKRSEINASLLNASFMGIWEKQSADANSYDEYDENEIDENGDVAVELESNVFRYAPDGFKLNQIASNHPNNSVKDFCKVILKGICGCLGLNYNKVNSDYA
ncbi:MAG: phage portal protein [Alphaproteobacteria bacterium]|nr:phage portal protein [Alphaproteobacteria bacterium]